ncbi:MAG TPA: class I SAM-dependent methyltransferase [Candidatus Micrarchaeia archaeon]|nr:class I SAM-dependent methyltransferase [Candidatus Micrarchaeia archaeon]
MTAQPPSPPAAVDWHDWLARWERMQAGHLHDRRGRVEVVLEACTLQDAGPDLAILELGCGPGGILVALARRHPSARLVGVDHDPLLLAIARETAGRRAGTQLVDGDLRRSDWVERLRRALGLDGGPAFDAVVSSTALHWLEPDQLRAAYAGAHRLLRPGGVLLNADRMEFGDAGLDRLAQVAREGGEAEAAEPETWSAWWSAIAGVPELAQLRAERDRRFPAVDHAHGHHSTESDHRRALLAAGFGRVEKLWAWYDSAVLCALR